MSTCTSCDRELLEAHGITKDFLDEPTGFVDESRTDDDESASPG